MNIVNCEFCGKPFEYNGVTSHSLGSYCSPKCSRDAWQRRFEEMDRRQKLRKRMKEEGYLP